LEVALRALLDSKRLPAHVELDRRLCGRRAAQFTFCHGASWTR